MYKKGYNMSHTICDYYLVEPIDRYSRPFITSFYPQVCLALPNVMCPLYAPCAKDGPCRYCGLTATKHRKFYLYSMYARQIQKCFLQYKYVKKVISIYMALYGNRLHRKWSSRGWLGLEVFLYRYGYEHPFYRHLHMRHRDDIEREIEIHFGFTRQCLM